MRCQLRCALATAFLVVEVERAASLQVQEAGELEDGRPDSSRRGALFRDGLRPQLWQWHMSTGGQSCDETCKAADLVCCDSALAKVNDKAAVHEVSREAGSSCDEALGYSSSEYPLKWADGQCAFTQRTDHYLATCGITTGSTVSRFCACHEVDPFGDPHMTNIAGNTFDILRAGPSSLLRLPALPPSEGEVNYQLRVDANVAHPGTKLHCSGYYIYELLIQGTLVGDPIKLSTHGFYQQEDGALEMMLGETPVGSKREAAAWTKHKPHILTFSDHRHKKSMRMVHSVDRVSFATLQLHLKGVVLDINWSTGMGRPNSLDIKASHLGALDDNWGGLLGRDDHSFVSTYDPQCKKSIDYHRHEQELLNLNRTTAPKLTPISSGTASLE